MHDRTVRDIRGRADQLSRRHDAAVDVVALGRIGIEVAQIRQRRTRSGPVSAKGLGRVLPHLRVAVTQQRLQCLNRRSSRDNARQFAQTRGRKSAHQRRHGFGQLQQFGQGLRVRAVAEFRGAPGQRLFGRGVHGLHD